MNRATCCTGGLLVLLALTGCRSSIFNPDLGSHFRLPGWPLGSRDVPKPPETLDGPDTGVAAVGGQPSDRESQPNATQTKLIAGRDAFRSGRLTTAAGHLEAVLAVQPNHVEAHHLMALITDRARDFTASDHHFETAIAAAPRNANLLSDYGFSKLQRSDLKSAEALLTRALSIDPSNSFALNNLGTVQARQGRYDDALATLRKAGPKAEAKLARLFPAGRPAADDTTASTGRVSADSPRQLPDNADDPVTARSQFADPATSTLDTDVPLVPSATGQLSSNSTPPKTLTTADPAHALIPVPPGSASTPTADLPSRPIPWAGTTDSLPGDPSGITPAGAITRSRRISPEFSRSAARLGLAIGPGSLVPHDTRHAAAPTETIPTQPAAATPVESAPAPAVSAGPITAPRVEANPDDPLSIFEKQLEDNSSTNRSTP